MSAISNFKIFFCCPLSLKELPAGTLTALYLAAGTRSQNIFGAE